MNRSTYKEPEYGVVHAVARPWQIKAGHSIVLHKGTKDNKKKVCPDMTSLEYFPLTLPIHRFDSSFLFV